MKELTERDIDRLLDGDCSPKEQKVLLGQLPAYPALQAYYEEAKQLGDSIAAQHTVVPEEPFSRALIVQLQEEVHKQQLTWWQRIDRRLLLFSSIMLVLLTTAFVTLPMEGMRWLQYQGKPLGSYLPEVTLPVVDIPWGSMQLISSVMGCLVLWLLLDKLIRPLFLPRVGSN